ncbi:hypothetical protein FQR65_LT20001 [Abscondita terminalis]|nr:hypothetical protein FQR65_LT20001 [Abscondita terminalis]
MLTKKSSKNCTWIAFFFLHLHVALNLKIGEYPHHVSLERDGIRVCSGAIIDLNKVLTIEHCLIYGNVTVRYGSDVVMTDGVVVKIERVVFHPFYKKHKPDYNLAVVIVKENFTFGPNCAPISIYWEYVPIELRNGWTSGWRRTSSKNKWSLKLSDARMEELGFTQCVRAWDTIFSKNLLCFENVDGNPCVGDSGAPLVDDSKLFLIGIIVAESLVCDQNNHPTVYVNVAMYYEWISNQIEFLKDATSSASNIKKFF